MKAVFCGADVDQNALVDFVEVERFVSHMLEIPGQRTVVGMKRERGAGVEVEIVHSGAAADLHPRLSLRDAPISEVQLGIVAAGDPGFTAGAQHVGKLAPGVAARGAFASHSVEMPKELARARIKGADEASLLAFLRLVAVATAEALQNFSADDDGAARIAESFVVVGDNGVPNDFAGAGIERDEMRVGSGHENLVLIDGQIARGASAAALLARGARASLPDQIAGAAVERLHNVIGIRNIDDAIVHQRAWAHWHCLHTSTRPRRAADYPRFAA